MTLIMGGRSLKLLYTIFTLLMYLKLALGFISGVGDGNMWCVERERQALLEFKKGLIDGNNGLSSWGSEYAKKNCCSWAGVQCSNQTGHVLEFFHNLRGCLKDSLRELYLSENKLNGTLGKRIESLNKLEVLSTCIFSVVDQPKGLVVCDNGSAPCKIAKDVSQLKATAISLKEILGLRYYMIFFFLGTHAMV
ncbi:receptor-like protein EIX1 isoform X2 [Fagus crenata]